MESIEKMIERWFKYHPPKGDQVERYGRIRAAAKEFAEVINENGFENGDSWEALQRLRVVVMIANASIACGEA